MLARLATRRAKPAGIYHVVREDVPGFLNSVCISDLHGFGSLMMKKAKEKLGETRLGALTSKSKAVLCDALGKATGETLYNAIRGVDERELEPLKSRKSVSCDINYGIRFETNEQAEKFIYQMAIEVSKRLEGVGMLGQSLTLKLMKRDSSAPVEPAKFLGHGPCDIYSKQTSLLGQGGRATKDSKLIAESAWRVLQSFNFDPKELRGIGIQINKLVTSSPKESKLFLGQETLPFPHVPEKNPTTKSPEPRDSDSGQKLMNVVPPSSPTVKQIKSESEYELPSYSQLDMDVFSALPLEMKEELQGVYQQRAAEKYSLQLGESSSPKKANHIVLKNQLDFRVRGTALSKFKSRNAFLKFKVKKGIPGTAEVTDSELKSLDIDPEVFRMLPLQVQYEQLAMLRVVKDKGFLPTSPTQRIAIRPRELQKIPEHLLWRAPLPKARYISLPVLSVQVEGKGKTPFTEAEDLQGALERWMGTYRRWPPKEKDVEYFSNFLEKAIDGRQYSDVSVQQAISVLKWWLVLLRRHWGGEEYVDESDDYPPLSPGDPIGQTWWKIFREVKLKMDVVFRRKFGGCISLK